MLAFHTFGFAYSLSLKQLRCLGSRKHWPEWQPSLALRAQDPISRDYGTKEEESKHGNVVGSGSSTPTHWALLKGAAFILPFVGTAAG